MSYNQKLKFTVPKSKLRGTQALRKEVTKIKLEKIVLKVILTIGFK